MNPIRDAAVYLLATTAAIALTHWWWLAIPGALLTASAFGRALYSSRTASA